jgi:hypothetical protein
MKAYFFLAVLTVLTAAAVADGSLGRLFGLGFVLLNREKKPEPWLPRGVVPVVVW